LGLSLGLGVLLLLCLGGVGVFFSLYDNATKIQRSEPDAVVDSYLGAYLVNRDDTAARLYECKSGGNFAAIQAYRADIQSREKTYSVGIRVAWSSFTVHKSGKAGTVTTDLTKSTGDGTERITKTWEFAMVDQDGWRVCGATELN
jgi:hypothetical protein